MLAVNCAGKCRRQFAAGTASCEGYFNSVYCPPPECYVVADWPSVSRKCIIIRPTIPLHSFPILISLYVCLLSAAGCPVAKRHEIGLSGAYKSNRNVVQLIQLSTSCAQPNPQMGVESDFDIYIKIVTQRWQTEPNCFGWTSDWLSVSPITAYHVVHAVVTNTSGL